MTGDDHVIDRERYDAVIFDMDGVITDTAKVHAAAWKELFDAFLRKRFQDDGEPFVEFTDDDYQRYVDGKPRYDGVRDFLASREISLPEGDSNDPPGTASVRALGNRKDQYFVRALANGVDPFVTSIEFVRRLQEAGFGTAVISASRNAELVLARAGLGALFPVQVDGVESEEMGLAGKPAPDIFLEATARLGVEPDRAVVVEDAQAGVEAGRLGGFGLIIGLDHVGQRQALREHGADIVVDDLREFSVRGLPTNDTRLRPIDDLPSALERWQEIATRLSAGTPAVLLDYDGTLTPIVERPEDAHLHPEMRETLAALSALCPVVIVSGRDASFVVSEVGLDRVYYLGSHGFEVVSPAGSDLTLDRSDEFRGFVPSLDAAQGALEAAVAAIPGARVERKRYAIAIHYRQVADMDVPAVKAIVDAELTHRPDLRKSGGKKIFELRPDIDWGKGHAVRWMLGALGLGGDATPVYIGDDLTDEDAFAELPRDGLTIVVGTGFRTTAAHYRLADPDEVARLLGLLAREIERG